MARQPLRFRSLLAAALICALILPARADAPLRVYTAAVEGSTARSITGFWDGAHVMLSLENLAAVLKYPIKRDRAARLLRVGNDVYSFSPGDSDVLLAGDPILQTTALPLERGRSLFVALTDLQTILAQDIALNGNRIEIGSLQAPQGVHAEPLQYSRVSAYTVRTDSGSGSPVGAAQPIGRRAFNTSDPTNALVVHVAISDYGGFSSRNLSFTTDGTRLRGSLDLSALENSPPAISGQVAIGTTERYVQFGYEGNPLGGLVFDAPGGIGFTVQRSGLAYGSEHDSFGRTIIAMRRDRADGSTIFGIIRANGKTVPVAGGRTSTDGLVKTTREVWFTGSGMAGSVAVATQGRIFGEAVASGVFGNVPLQIGEAPERLDVGFRASDRLMFRAGVTSGYGLKASPYLSALIFGNRLTGSLQFAGNYRTASASYTAQQGSLAGSYTASPDGATWSLAGSITQRRRLWEFSAYQGANDQDEVIRTHTTTGPGFILGAERVVSSGHTRIGPIVGISLPVGRSSSFELTEHPTSTGRTLGFGFTQRIAFAPRLRLRTIAIEDAGAADLYLDDHLMRRIDAGIRSVAIPAGEHRLQARSADGNFASLPVTIDAQTSSVNVALLPLRPVAGRVVLADADPAGRQTSLGHIQIKLEPGDVLAETEPDGSFVFPATPTAANARVSIVADSLAQDLMVGDDAAAGALPLVLTVKTRVKVHRKKF